MQNDQSGSVQEIRLALLAYIVSPTLDVSLLSSLPDEDLVYPLLALYFLIHETERLVLEDWEVDAFIAQHFLLKQWDPE